MNVNLTVAETDRSINMTVSDDLHEISLDASQDSYEFEMDVDGEIDFDVASYSGAYLFRQLPYSSNAKSLRKLVGCSFAWNQLQENGNFESTSNIEAYYGTISASNGVLSYTVSSIALNEWSSQIRMPSVSCVDGHKHLITFAIKPAHSKTNQAVAFLLRTSGSGPNIGFGRFNLVGGEWNRIGYIANVNASGTTYGTLQILFNATSDNGYSVGDVDQVKDIMCIDLTRLFGSTIADYIYGLGNTDGVAFFKNLFSKDYYPYDSGTLVSVKTSASTMKNADESASSSYALSNTELRGIPKLDANNKLYYDGDEYTADGTVKRKYGIVDLGTLSWTKRNTSTGHWRFTTQDIPIKWNSASDAVGNMVCPRYQSVSASNTWNGITGISSHTTMTQLLVCDETYSDAATFKSAMSGVYLIYELATPTTESATAYTQAQKCYPNGTEEFVDGRTVEVPVWNEAKYIVRQ